MHTGSTSTLNEESKLEIVAIQRNSRGMSQLTQIAELQGKNTHPHKQIQTSRKMHRDSTERNKYLWNDLPFVSSLKPSLLYYFDLNA